MRFRDKPVIILVTVLLLFKLMHAQINEKAVAGTTGRIINQYGEPAIDVTVVNLSTYFSTSTNSKGIFYFRVLKPKTYLKLYGVNIKTDTFFVYRIQDIVIQVEEKLGHSHQTVAAPLKTAYRQLR
ncbi:hypothetical protein [Longitalea luteola]|uniref:hypothetical protein n=1 Tax=Longitalea luteola TaxID=2812563 RepID=UPI001A95D6F0|nr:hypothetical protein [Longitalea luteola]